MRNLKRRFFRIAGFLQVVLMIAACTSPGPDTGLVLRADITKAHMDEAIAFEEALSPNYDRLPASGEAWFDLLRGTSRVLVTAPHATNPMREGRLRFADVGTGWLAVMLHRLAGATVLHTTMASPSDPNYYNDNAFKETLNRLIEEVGPVLVLDLHGSHWSRPFDVDFGTMDGASLHGKDDYLTLLKSCLEREGLHNFSLNYFGASKHATVTKWVSRSGVPCIQLEFSSTWLNPGEGKLSAHRSAQLLQGMVRFIRNIDRRSGNMAGLVSSNDPVN